MTRSLPLKIAILGGGISGLAAAYAVACARQGGAPVEEVLIEAGGRWGGLIRTDRIDGFTIEAGPDSFVTAKPEAAQLARELGLEAELAGSNDAVRQSYILHRGRLEPLPEGLTQFVPARLSAAFRSRLIPLRGKLAILGDALRFHRGPVRESDESVSDLVRRHLGTGVLDTIVDPLLAGVYGGNSAELSAQAILPALVRLEERDGSLVRGLMRARKAVVASGPIFTTLASGLEELPHALVRELEARSGSVSPRLVLNQRAEWIVAQSGSAAPLGQTRYAIRCQAGNTYEAGAVILALPATESARLLQSLDPPLSEKLAAIPYSPAVTVSLAYRNLDRRLPRGFGFLVTRRERRHLLACTFVQAKFPHRAPEGAMLLRCFLGGVHEATAVRMSDDELVQVTSRELGEILGIVQPALFHRIYRWPLAMPQYVVGHRKRVAEIERCVRRYPGLFLAGNAYHGVGISDCIRSARLAVEAACKFAIDA